MIKKTIKYTDYNGDERTEDYWFNLNKAELAKLELGSEGGLENLIRSIIDERNTEKLAQIFDKIILMSYGRKSPDGRRFIKRTPEGTPLADEFVDSEAYSSLFFEFITDSKQFAYFLTGVIPEEMLPKGKSKDELVAETMAKAESGEF